MKRALTRRSFVSATATVLAGSALAACQPKVVEVEKVVKETVEVAVKETVLVEKQVEVTAPVPTAATSTRRELEFSVWGQWELTYGKMAREYLPTVSDTTVNVTSAPQADYHDRLLTRFASGSVPDIAMIVDFDFPRFWPRDLLNDLNPYVATVSGWDQSKPGYGHFYPVICEFFKPEGKQYSIPAEVNPQPIAYNMDLFEEAGVPSPYDQWKADQWDWTAFVETAKRMDTGEGESRIFGYTSGAMKIWGFAQEIWANEGDIFNEDRTEFRLLEPAAVEVIQAYVDLFLVHEITPSHIRSVDTEPTKYFPQGRCAMIHGSTWLRPTMQQSDVKWGIAPQPKWRTYGCWTGGFSYSIPKGAKDLDGSWEIIERTSSVDGAKWLLRNGHCGSSVIEAMNSEAFLYEPPANPEVYTWMLDYAKPQPFIKENYKFMQIWDREMDLAATGEKTAQEACEAIVKEATPLLSA